VADPRRYACGSKRFVAKTASFATAHDELTAAENQWLTLELRREEIKGV
jgi:ATP-binding cassette subfamily F protein uup